MTLYYIFFLKCLAGNWIWDNHVLKLNHWHTNKHQQAYTHANRLQIPATAIWRFNGQKCCRKGEGSLRWDMQGLKLLVDNKLLIMFSVNYYWNENPLQLLHLHVSIKPKHYNLLLSLNKILTDTFAYSQKTLMLYLFDHCCLFTIVMPFCWTNVWWCVRHIPVHLCFIDNTIKTINAHSIYRAGLTQRL